MLGSHVSCGRGEVGECEQRCTALLRANPFNEEAGDILVYLMIHRELYESAILHFQQILERDPNHYSALSQVNYLILVSFHNVGMRYDEL
jgi:tetratricopeptide repeat protein 21B